MRMIGPVEFIEAPLFTQLLPDFLTDDEFRKLQQHLSRDPEAGDMIPGPAASGSCGGRILIYYYFLADSQIWLMTVYDKDSMIDLSPAEKRVLKAAIERETQEHARRRTARRK